MVEFSDPYAEVHCGGVTAATRLAAIERSARALVSAMFVMGWKVFWKVLVKHREVVMEMRCNEMEGPAKFYTWRLRAR